MSRAEVLVESIEPPSWTESLGGFAGSVLDRLEKRDWVVGILLTDPAGIRERNRKWREIDAPTDVLSFPADPVDGEEERDAGDLIIAPEVVRENAAEYGVPFDEELRRVTVHGILHLAGMDHPGDDYEGEMLSLQESILREFAGTRITGEYE